LLYRPDVGRLHRLPPHCKLLATVAFTLAVVSTPREQLWAFAADALILTAVATLGRIPIAFIARRAVIELPFVAFAVLLPVVGRAPNLDVVGLRLSEPGLWSAWNIICKGTLGVAAAVTLAATTPVEQILAGLERLKMPRLLVAMTGFMVRYGHVLTDEMARMRIARESRGRPCRHLWQAKALAQSGGTLFVRAYERGERVHLAMQARGYAGTMPQREVAASARQWAWCLVVPACAAAVSGAAWLVR
jgi:cobalt/nickel transport system permease protein